jgi:hypothetical protein
VRRLERNGWIEQPPQNRGRAAEREIRHDLERLARKRHTPDIGNEDVDGGEAPAQAFAQLGVDLDGDDAIAAPCERRSQDARTGPDIEDEVVALDSGRANELRCEPATAEKVLAAAAL